MSNQKTVRVGIMPGRINEFAVEVGQSIASVLELAGLSTQGYEVKVDGTKVTDLNATTVTASTNLILLAKVVKGNMSKTVRVGIMPGRINEYAVEVGQSIASVLQLAGLDAKGYEVKVDGTKVDNLDTATVTTSTNLVLLAKIVKGNSKTVRVGVMPGRINEYAVEEGQSIASVIALAGLDTKGFEVKVDGQKVDNLDSATVTSSTNLILLAKVVKGNISLI